MLVFICAMAVYSVSIHGDKQSSYQSIIIKKGDTLWGIANIYGYNSDNRNYIYQIKKLNNMVTSDIYEGSELIIPGK